MRRDKDLFEEASKLSKQVGQLLQRLENILRKGAIEALPPDSLVRFPRGYLRKVVTFRERIPFVQSDTLARNIAYAYQYTDFLRWILNRFDVAFSLRSIHIKVGLVVVAAICEAQTVSFVEEHLREKLPERGKFARAIDILHKKGVIDELLREKLHVVRRYRNNIHIQATEDSELDKYNLELYNEAILTLKTLNECLKDAYQNKSNPVRD